jgi:CheY-like chemotaxis protein
MMRKMKAGSLVDLVNMAARLRPPSAPSSHGSKAWSNRRAAPIVFVVDGDDTVRESLESLIQSAGWQPEIFACRQEFLSRERVLASSCLILDVALADLSGLDLQQLVAERIEMPTIFITACADVPNRRLLRVVRREK